MKKENVVGAIKEIGAFANEWGAQSLACALCRVVLPPQVNLAVKGGVLVGGWLLGGCIGEHTSRYLDKQIDTFADLVSERANRIKEDIAKIQETSDEDTAESKETDQTDQTNETHEEKGDLG